MTKNSFDQPRTKIKRTDTGYVLYIDDIPAQTFSFDEFDDLARQVMDIVQVRLSARELAKRAVPIPVGTLPARGDFQRHFRVSADTDGQFRISGHHSLGTAEFSESELWHLLQVCVIFSASNRDGAELAKMVLEALGFKWVD